MANITINLDQLNQTFANALPGHQAKAEERQAAAFASMPSIGGALSGAADVINKARETDADFVKSWPKVRDMITMGINLVSRIPFLSSYAAVAKAWIDTFEKVVFPLLQQAAAKG